MAKVVMELDEFNEKLEESFNKGVDSVSKPLIILELSGDQARFEVELRCSFYETLNQSMSVYFAGETFDIDINDEFGRTLGADEVLNLIHKGISEIIAKNIINENIDKVYDSFPRRTRGLFGGG